MCPHLSSSLLYHIRIFKGLASLAYILVLSLSITHAFRMFRFQLLSLFSLQLYIYIILHHFIETLQQHRILMDDQLGGNVQSNANPHWTGDTSKVRCGSDGSFIIPARALNITWGNDPRYWEWTKIDDTESKVAGGFEEGAALQQVNWLEVTGRFELVTSSIRKIPREYKVYYVMKLNEDAFGWNHALVKFKVKLEDERDGGAYYSEMEVNLQQYRDRKPGTWHRVCVGEFNVVGNGSSVNVEIGMFEVETDWWKGSVVLGGILIEPNNCELLV